MQAAELGLIRAEGLIIVFFQGGFSNKTVLSSLFHRRNGNRKKINIRDLKPDSVATGFGRKAPPRLRQCPQTLFPFDVIEGMKVCDLEHSFG